MCAVIMVLESMVFVVLRGLERQTRNSLATQQAGGLTSYVFCWLVCIVRLSFVVIVWCRLLLGGTTNMSVLYRLLCDGRQDGSVWLA